MTNKLDENGLLPCREAFEKYVKETIYRYKLSGMSLDFHDGRYTNNETQTHWHIWQAAWNTRAQPIDKAAESVEELTDGLLDAVNEQCNDGAGYWSACSGCHQTDEGVSMGRFSNILQTNLGIGCRECGGLGAVWSEIRVELSQPKQSESVGGDVQAAISDIINVAAFLVQGAEIPSYAKEDYSRNVPAWLLRELENSHDNLRIQANKLKNATDTIRAALSAPKQEPVNVETIKTLTDAINEIVPASWQDFFHEQVAALTAQPTAVNGDIVALFDDGYEGSDPKAGTNHYEWKFDDVTRIKQAITRAEAGQKVEQIGLTQDDIILANTQHLNSKWSVEGSKAMCRVVNAAREYLKLQDKG